MTAISRHPSSRGSSDPLGGTPLFTDVLGNFQQNSKSKKINFWILVAFNMASSIISTLHEKKYCRTPLTFSDDHDSGDPVGRPLLILRCWSRCNSVLTMGAVAYHFKPLAKFVFFSAVILLLSSPDVAFGQPPRREPNAGDQAAGCACCGSMLLMIVAPIVVAVLYFLINIAILFWVAKDAKSRGMDGAMWIFLILFTGFVGLAIYLFSRPQGLLTQCGNCGNNRMETTTKCPHCGIKTGVGESRGSQRRRRDEEDEVDDEDDDDGRTSVRPSSRR